MCKIYVMENISSTSVPLGSLAVLFAATTILVLVSKTIKARAVDEAIKNNMTEKRLQKNRPLSEQKKRLEELLKK